MKKYFSLASALMLALGMGMTSCSNDLDEVQAPAEQQPEMHKLYLSATAPNSTETRAFVEGTADSDAITITGWKDGDEIKGWWVTPNPENATSPNWDNVAPSAYGSVTFRFIAATQKFESEPTSVALTDIKLLTHGLGTGVSNLWGNAEDSDPDYYYHRYMFKATADLQVDLDNHLTNIPLCAVAPTVSGDELVANMQLPNDFAVVCIHNESTSPIEVKICTNVMLLGYGSTQCTKVFGLDCNYIADAADWTSGSFTAEWNNITYSAGEAASVNIGVGEKAYLPLKAGNNNQAILVNGTSFKTTDPALTAGKVYKVTYTGL